MTSIDKINALKKLKGWQVVCDIAIGGFEWLGFSQERPEMLFIISSQKNTVLYCNNGEVRNCELIYDEEELVAFSDLVGDEHIHLVGQYGGELKVKAIQGDEIFKEKNELNVSHLIFITKDKEQISIFENYGLYTYGFSYDGNYFVICTDGSLTVMKRV